MTTSEQLAHPDRIAGYDYAGPHLGRSPVTLAELAKIETATGLTEDDALWLCRAGELLTPQAARLVDGWRAQLSRHPHLSWHGGHPDGTPNPDYAAASHPRFARWIIDLCTRERDQEWLDYQHEIGRRHTTDAKNVTDGVTSTPYIPMRYLLAFVPTVLSGLRKVLAESGEPRADVDAMTEAVTKSVMLHVTLWTRAYAEHPEQW